mmetsp:Transcript_28036/g.45123  ORF Transcript_28036/g.45123 Transcript_28036/m.45123 type:complete len:148 (-) Transcript_28036:36-479(-)
MALFLEPDCTQWKEITWKEHRALSYRAELERKARKSNSLPSVGLVDPALTQLRQFRSGMLDPLRPEIKWREDKHHWVTEAQRQQKGYRDWKDRRFITQVSQNRFEGAPNPFRALKPRLDTARSLSYHSGVSKSTPSFSEWAARPGVK